MIRTNFFRAIAAVCIVSLTMASCNKEALIPDLELRNATLTETESRLISVSPEVENTSASRGGKCFQLNYPVSIITPEGDENVIADRKSLKTFFQNYRAEGGEKGDLTFAYPIEVTLEDGTLMAVATPEDMQTLKESCPQRERGEGRPGRGNGERCFSINFPLTATASDGSTLTLEDKRDFKKFKKSVAMALENGEATPTLNFPIEIMVEEESLSITSQTELDNLIADCRQN